MSNLLSDPLQAWNRIAAIPLDPYQVPTASVAGVRLHLGCGFRRYPGFVNVDSNPACSPDVVLDLESTPWPWDDNSASEIVMEHVLEHLGQTPDAFIHVLQEIYRVCKNNAVIRIIVPHPEHKVFQIDPTHVRTVRPETLMMFDQQRNRETIAAGGSETPLGLYHNINFRLDYVNMVPDAWWQAEMEAGRCSAQDLQAAESRFSNVIIEIRMVLCAIKPVQS